MTKSRIGIMDGSAFILGGEELMTLDPFKDARWQDQMSAPNADGMVTVTLSTGKKVTVNSRLLALLRVLADELAREETGLH